MFSRLPVAIVVVALLTALLGAPSGAETPTEVVEQTVRDGTYVARARSDVDESMFEAAVSAAADAGLSLLVIAPADPVPDAKAFALRVRQEAEADVTLLFGYDGVIEASVSDDFGNEAVRALAAARAAVSPEQAADVYVVELTVEPARQRPEIVDRLSNAVFILLIVLGAAVFAELGWRSFRTRNQPRQQA